MPGPEWAAGLHTLTSTFQQQHPPHKEEDTFSYTKQLTILFHHSMYD